MPILAVVVVALVIVLSVHICRTGRSRMWLPVIWLLPVVGSLIYVFVEMLPQLFRGDDVVSLEDARRAQRRDRLPDRPPAPRSDVQWSRRQQSQSQPPPGHRSSRPRVEPRRADMFRTPKDPLREGMIHEKLRRAEACLTRHQYDEAVDLFASARQGFFADSPDIVFGLARAHFGRSDFDAALNLVDELVTGRPAYQPHAVAILKARVLAKQGDVTAALALLDSILAQTDNLEGHRLEAQYRRAEILWQNGETHEATIGLNEIIRHAQLFNITDDERHWIGLADQALQAIS